jgi:C4-dicarboxylate-binding protein DctP
MKKVLALILTAALVLALASCGSGTESSTPTPAASASAPTASSTAPAQNEGNYPTAEKPLTISLGHSTPEKSSGNTQAMIFKEKIEELSGGAILVDVYPGSQLGNEATMLDGVYSGTMDAGIISGTVLTSILPQVNAWYLPFLFKDLADLGSTIYTDEFYDYNAKLFEEETGMHFLGIPILSARGLLTDQHAVTTPDDMKGLTIRCIQGQIIMDIFAAMGASTTQLAFNEVYTALQQGVIDGLENGLSDCIEMKFVEVGKYYTDTTQCINSMALVVSDNVWQKLSPDQQVMMREACKAAEDVIVENQTAVIDEAYKTGAEQYGIEVTRLTDEQREAFKEKCQSVYDKYKPVIGEEYYNWFTALAQK